VHACACMHCLAVHLALYTYGAPKRASVRPSARARSCVCAWARPQPRRACEHLMPPSTARRRLAGVPVGVGLQRKHRRVEHRLRHGLDYGMRRFRALRGGCARPVFNAARPLCVAAPPMYVCACACELACACACPCMSECIQLHIIPVYRYEYFSRRVRIARAYTRHCIRARAGPSCCARVFVCVVRRVCLARHPCVRYIKV
jgi:hypothetical protein